MTKQPRIRRCAIALLLLMVLTLGCDGSEPAKLREEPVGEGLNPSPGANQGPPTKIKMH